MCEVLLRQIRAKALTDISENGIWEAGQARPSHSPHQCVCELVLGVGQAGLQHPLGSMVAGCGSGLDQVTASSDRRETQIWGTARARLQIPLMHVRAWSGHQHGAAS